MNKKAQVVVAYHPVLFSAIKRITPGSGVKQRVVLRAIEAGIAVYCPHTAFDNMNPGINDWICKGIGARVLQHGGALAKCRIGNNNTH